MLPLPSSPRIDSLVSKTASRESSRSKVSPPSGEETPPTSSGISLPRPSTSPARINTRRSSTLTTPRRSQSSSSSVTALPVVPPVLHPSASCTLLTSPEPASLLMSAQVPSVSSVASSTASRRFSPRTVPRVSTEASESPSSESLPTAPLTSACSILVRPSCSLMPRTLTSS